jgi:RNA polymerase sigma-70 factor (ECF subfamily)
MKDERIEIEAIIAGQTGRYRPFVERYQNPVFRVIYKIVNDYQEAGELTQDVFVKAYESLNQYNPEYKFFSWIYRMAINRALLHLRNRKPYVELIKSLCGKHCRETATYDYITKISCNKGLNE